MDDTVAWLRDRPYHENQIRAHEVIPGAQAAHRDMDLDDRLQSALRDRGIERRGHQTVVFTGARQTAER